MIEEYFILVRRIPGISLSINDYWELDTFTTQKLLNLEGEIMELEREEADKANGKKKYTEEHEGDSEEMKDLMEEMTVE